MMTKGIGSQGPKRRFLVWFAAIALVAFVVMDIVPSALAEGPAVSEINGKADVLWGHFDSENSYIGSGSLSLPIGEKFGAQIDLAGGDISTDYYWGTGAHLFWRDPEVGLIGLIASYQELDNTSHIRQGVEAEYYMNDITLATRLAYQYGDVDHGGSMKVDVRYYPRNNLMLEFETGVHAGDFLGSLGIEYQLDLAQISGLCVFAEGAVGEGRYDRWFGGIRYYFGSKKSLKKRHRTDDPSSLTPEGMGAMQEEAYKARPTPFIVPEPEPEPEPG